MEKQGQFIFRMFCDDCECEKEFFASFGSCCKNCIMFVSCCRDCGAIKIVKMHTLDFMELLKERNENGK